MLVARQLDRGWAGTGRLAALSPARKGNLMHAVVVKVTIADRNAAEGALREQVVPGVSGAPGFIAGYWVNISGDKGISMSVFESEEAAKAVAENDLPTAPVGVTIDSVEVGEVVANA